MSRKDKQVILQDVYDVGSNKEIATKQGETISMFENQKNSWEEEWQGMPEYKNVVQAEPEIVVIFKFRSKHDFDIFHCHVKEYLYKGARIFDGMQRKNKKSTWYPLNPKAGNFKYVNES